MTIGIGAILPKYGAIIAVSDMMLSNDERSVDVAAFKCWPIFKGRQRWWALYAGLPTEYERLKWSLGTTPVPDTLEGAMLAVEQAYDRLRHHHIERNLLSSYGLTHDEFISSGAQFFGEAYFRELLERCNDEFYVKKIQTDLLVMGFDVDNRPHIFEKRHDSACELFDDFGFHAVGAGAWAALGSLSIHSDDLLNPQNLSSVIYRLCEAKFVSEMARSVGEKMTLVQVNYSNGVQSDLYIGGEDDPIRVAWAKRQAIPIPADVFTEIEEQELSGRMQIDQQQTEDPEPTKPS